MPVPNPTVPTGLTAGSQSKLYLGVSFVVTAGAGSTANSVVVEPLQGMIPSGTTLTFTGAKNVTTSAQVEPGATAIPVDANGAAISDGDEATVTDGMAEMPTISELSFTPAGSVQSIPLFGTEFDRAVKTGLSGTLNFQTLAPATDVRVSDVVAAGMGVGPTAQLKFAVLNPDATYFSGVAVVAAPTPVYEARGVFGYSFEMTTDGTITRS